MNPGRFRMTQSTATVGHSGHSSQGPIIGIVAVLAAFVIVAFVAMLVTRSGSSSSTSATTSQVSAVVKSSQQVSSIGQAQTSGDSFTRPANAVRIGDVLFTVVSVKTPDAKPREAHLKYVTVQLTAQNVGQLSASDWSLALIDSDGVKNSEAPDFNDSNYLALTGLQAGAQVQGSVTFKVLADAKPKELQYSSKSGASGVIPLK
ncbi:MAG: DUF4352 domain-containing protein, partial [bacterium]|nr:DUF4352 domain-containing protein [bacterium]